MIIKYDKELTERVPEIYNYVDSQNLWAIVYFIVNSNARKSVVVQEWLKEYIKNPCQELIDICKKEIKIDKNHDYTMTEILRWVIKNIKYVPDSTKWKMGDRWQSPQETIVSGTGDCEDGAILIYAMAIQCGVPESRVLLMCGDVLGGGHCWCSYRSTEYPLNWCFMDWCYWPDTRSPDSRQKYYILDTTIYDDPKKQYYKIWFAFNHINAYRGLMNGY